MDKNDNEMKLGQLRNESVTLAGAVPYQLCLSVVQLGKSLRPLEDPMMPDIFNGTL